MHVLGFLLIFCALPPLSAHSQETGSRGLQELRAQANHRIALCIGVNHYADQKLNALKQTAIQQSSLQFLTGKSP